jgi:hypothetical protein
VEKVNSQNADLRKVIDKEEVLAEAADKKKKEIEKMISNCKRGYLDKL